MLDYLQDVTQFYTLDPLVQQNVNMFFLESKVRSNKNNYYDIFEFTEDYNTKFFENSDTQSYTKRIADRIPASEREYLNIYFRADSYSRFY